MSSPKGSEMTGVAERSTRSAFVSVETAARFLGISRGMAYQQARQHLAHGGGLRCVRIGHRLLVPVAWLEQLAGLPVDGDVLPPAG